MENKNEPSKKEIESTITVVEIVKEKIKQSKTVDAALKIIEQDLKTAREALKTKNLNGDFYEEVTLNIPKVVMDFLRKTEKNPIGDMEYRLVDNVRLQIEGMGPEEWARLFQLKTIFAEFLGEERYAEKKEMQDIILT